MNGNKLFLDTNIILYLLNGDNVLALLLNERQLYISFVTELELLGYLEISKKEEKIMREFLSLCRIVGMNDQIKDETIRIRKAYKSKLPDSIIAATAIHLDLPIITADIAFKRIEELSLVLYEK